jgi:hypothetical protein
MSVTQSHYFRHQYNTKSWPKEIKKWFKRRKKFFQKARVEVDSPLTVHYFLEFLLHSTCPIHNFCARSQVKIQTSAAHFWSL